MTQAPAPAKPVAALTPNGAPLQLSRAEYDTIRALRSVDAFKFGAERAIVLLWNGARLRVLDSVQVSL